MIRHLGVAAGALGLALLAGPAFAAFTTVNLDSYVNGNVAINPDQLPIGTSNGNKGSGITFAVSASPNNAAYSGVWLSPGFTGASLTVSGLSVSGGASFYALLNNYYGTPGVDEYDITIATATQSVTYQSFGGIDTRDYNANFYTNTIANTTTEWFNNGVGQRYDVREFTLPNAFTSDTITSFTITQAHAGDNAIFAGLTFSTAAPVTFGVPEPATWAMMVLGFLGAGAGLRRGRAALVRG